MQTEILENYYTLQEVAKKLKINNQTLYNWIKAGKINCYKSGRKYLFSDSDILDKLNKNRINNDNE